jgi:cytochrome c oxidase subunit II
MQLRPEARRRASATLSGCTLLPTDGGIMEQSIAVFVSAILGASLLIIFAGVARSASSTASPDVVTSSAARWRRTVLWTLVLVFVPVIGYSLTKMPYPSDASPADVTVQATAQQWAWTIKPDTVPAGKVVEIRVTGADVNHGFGLYDPDNRLITQTQAMPGFTNVIRHTFRTPGTYRILCLEYCGLGHHTMFSQIVVTAPTSEAKP